MIKGKNKCDLNTCFLCRFCLKDWKPAIDVNKKNLKLNKGQQVFKEGDPVKGIYFVYSGTVKIHKKWDDEKELIVRFAKQGDVLGHLGLGGSGYYPVSATAIEEAIVCFIEMDFLESTMNVNNAFVIQLMLFFASELQESERRMRNLAHMSVKGRVAQALLSLQEQFGVNKEGFINIELSRQDLAAFIGASYESLFRAINELFAENIIVISGKTIAINNGSAFDMSRIQH
ncbi:Crp/Fnr family transcriptional regulator [Pedobacter antarcticus]|uniref:Crp/Fnr family transcriptional regulator n=1 Tax=Pedobacter antarcticus TaxID=34086 RepID=UPI00088E2D68|nr:Crp/Fnr family transcriptional regulator [Pedobacter antarcticus]SDL53012.1 CRP/FNR family transcriptional regulator, anaerobic regulatory protein [Pedobacter antarcticus]